MFCVFFFNDTATTEIYTLSLHDALPILSTLIGETTSHGYTDGEGTSARFNLISSFVQVNSTYWILVDQGNHCIRGVLKSSPRSRLGVLYNTSTKFNTPSKIIKAPKKD